MSEKSRLEPKIRKGLRVFIGPTVKTTLLGYFGATFDYQFFGTVVTVVVSGVCLLVSWFRFPF